MGDTKSRADLLPSTRICTLSGIAGTVLAVLRDGTYIVALDGSPYRHEMPASQLEALLCFDCQSAPVSDYEVDDGIERCWWCASTRADALAWRGVVSL